MMTRMVTRYVNSQLKRRPQYANMISNPSFLWILIKHILLNPSYRIVTGNPKEEIETIESELSHKDNLLLFLRYYLF